MSTCRSCGAAIRWVTTAANGRPMPLDPVPVPDGNLVLTYPSPGTALALSVDPAQLTLDDEPPPQLLGDPPRYVSHYATCPDAAAWRKR